MKKLTATGLAFGESEGTTLPNGTYDWVWDKIKHKFASESSWAMRALKELREKHGISRTFEHQFLHTTLREAFPDEISEEDYNRYIDELQLIIDNS